MDLKNNETLTYNYSNVFFSYFFDYDMECSYKPVNHALIYVYSGEMVFEEGSKRTVARAGECMFVRRDHRVKVTKKSLKDEKFGAINMSFTRNFLRNFFQKMEKKDFPLESRKHKLSVMKLNSSPEIQSLFKSMLPYFDTNIKPSEKLIELKIQEGIYALLNIDERFYPCLFDFTEPWKIDIMDFLNQNYMYDLSLEEIATYTGRSLASFKRDFKKISSLTPQRWIINKRLRVAYDKMETEGTKPADIFTVVGFKNLSHFYTAFKREYGYSPRK